MKRFSHPEHGWHVATEAEAEALLKAGWKECGWEVQKTEQPEPRKVLALPKKR